MTLSDCFTELVCYIKSQSEDHFASVSIETLRTGVDKLIKRSRQHFEKSDGFHNQYDSALFAILAWIDETILCSSWKERRHWKSDKLQQRYFNTSEAGRLFFQKLAQIPTTDKELIEVYWLCLHLGFKGIYFSPQDQQTLETIKNQCLENMQGDQSFPRTLEEWILFPDALPHIQTSPYHFKQHILLNHLSLYLLPLLPCVMVMIIYYLIINNKIKAMMALLS